MKRFFIFFAIFTFFFISCDSKIQIDFSGNQKATVHFSTVLGPSILETISAFSDSQNFDDEEIILNAQSLGLKNVKSDSSNQKIDFKGTLLPDFDSILLKSNIIQIQNKKIELSPQNLLNFYQNCPEDFKTYLDLFMAPVFTQENLSDEEYFSTIQEVYGEPLANEIKNSSINIIFTDEKNRKISKNIPLLNILNLKEKIELK